MAVSVQRYSARNISRSFKFKESVDITSCEEISS